MAPSTWPGRRYPSSSPGKQHHPPLTDSTAQHNKAQDVPFPTCLVCRELRDPSADENAKMSLVRLLANIIVQVRT